MRRDDKGYQDFVFARYRHLVRCAVLLGCSPEDAEDATQEALTRCYGAWSRVIAADDPDAYVYWVLVNGISRSRRRRWRGEVPHAELPETPGGDPAPGVTLGVVVREALGRLGDNQRQVLVLRYFADLTESQIAAVLHVAPGTVKSRASRGLTALSQDAALADVLITPTEEDR